MPSAKSGAPGTIVAPQAPTAAADADTADPGEMEEIKSQQKQTGTGKYGTADVKPFKKPDPAAAPAGGAADAAGDAGGAGGAAAAAGDSSDDAKKHYIEITVTDEDGNPMPGEPYSLTLPDGSVCASTLSDKGFARVDGIDAGSCTFSLPNRGDDEWHA